MATKHPNSVLRDQAIAAGQTRYTPCVPCKRGHLSERYTKNKACIQCLKFKSDQWISNNPDRAKAIKDKYACKPASKAKIKERKRIWLQNNLDVARLRVARYRAANPEKVKAFPSAKSPNKALYRAAHREKQSAYHKQWKLDNPERVRALHMKRNALKRGTVGSFTADDVRAIFKAQKGKCAYCRTKLGKKYHVDHIVALINGGTNDRRNIQITCPPCNLRKNRKDPIDYARSQGMLL